MPFQKGQSGNPSGRPKGLGRVQDIAKQHTEKAIQCLVDIIDNSDANTSSRVAAATALLDRGWGKPTQPIAGEEDGAAIIHRIERVIIDQPEPRKLT